MDILLEIIEALLDLLWSPVKAHKADVIYADFSEDLDKTLSQLLLWKLRRWDWPDKHMYVFSPFLTVLFVFSCM